MSENRAVFLSYASQDAEAARRICETLRASGIEVWFDQSELRGGDQWDQSIRRQIRECMLFAPVISANTQARGEGYFRLEWKLAADRSHLMARDQWFFLPIVIDDTPYAEARVPEEFHAVQWTRLVGGETPESFCARVQKMLAGVSAGGGSRQAFAGEDEAWPRTTPKKTSPRRWIVAAGAGALAITSLAWWRPWVREEKPASVPPVAAVVLSSELARLRARVQPDRWQKDDYDAVSPTLDRLLQVNPENAEAWALRSIINSLQVIRTFDRSTKPLTVGKAAAERALLLAPGLPLGELALGMHFTAMMSRGGDVQAARPHIERAVAALPRDAMVRFGELTSYWLSYNFEETERSAKAWLQAEPRAGFPAWILAQLSLTTRRVAETERWAEQVGADEGITGVRALVSFFDAQYYLRADLAAAEAILNRIPPEAQLVHRVLFARWLVTMANGRWDQALQDLARVPESMLFDRSFYGPKALLAGLSHQAAGRPEPAVAQFQEAERLLREYLAGDADNEELHAVRALTLAASGRAAEARSELALVEPVVRGRARSVYTGQIVLLLAQTHTALGDAEKAAGWLRLHLSGPSSIPLTPASLKLDPRFRLAISEPPMQALLKEFNRLDVPKTPAAPPPEDFAVAKSAAKSVAVLPFENLSGDKANEYFSDGISDELLNLLGKVPGLRVAGRTSAFSFKGRQVTDTEIAQKLGVTYLVNGSVQKSGDQVRITARLTNAADGYQLWSDRFTKELKDIFAVQDEIATLIAQALQVKLGATPRAAQTVDPDAHRLVLEGRYHSSLRTKDGFVRAEAAFGQAIARDAEFALAHAGLAEAWVMRANYTTQDGASVGDGLADLKRARAAAQRAITIDPATTEAFAVLGYCDFMEGRYGDAERQYERALELSPNSSIFYAWRAMLRLGQGRLEEGVKDLEKTVALDPLWPVSLANYADVLLRVGRLNEALQSAERAVNLRQGVYLPVLGARAQILLVLGRRDAAVADARLIRKHLPENPRRGADEAAIWVLRQAGLEAEATAYLEEYFLTLPAMSQQRGYALGAAGRFDEALPFLERTPANVRRRLYWDPIWDPWREDPRFLQLMTRLGCAEEYRVARATLARLLKEPPAKR